MTWSTTALGGGATGVAAKFSEFCDGGWRGRRRMARGRRCFGGFQVIDARAQRRVFLFQRIEALQNQFFGRSRYGRTRQRATDRHHTYEEGYSGE